MVLIVDLLQRVSADEVVVCADGNAKACLVTNLNDLLCRLWREIVILKMCGHMVLAVRIAAEDAHLKALRSNLKRTLNDALKILLAGESGCHEPNWVVAGLGLSGASKSITRCERTHRSQCGRRLEQISSCGIGHIISLGLPIVFNLSSITKEDGFLNHRCDLFRVCDEIKRSAVNNILVVDEDGFHPYGQRIFLHPFFCDEPKILSTTIAIAPSPAILQAVPMESVVR